MNATDADPAPWYERHPERRAWELAEFEALGLPAIERITEDGQLIIDTALTFRGQELPIEVDFPGDYPEFPPGMFAEQGLLDRHQNHHGNLCVLADPENDWDPIWSAAQLVDGNLRSLLAASELGAEAVSAGEADMVESLSAMIEFTGDDAVLVPDPFWDGEPAVPHGPMALLDLGAGRVYLLTHADRQGAADPGLADRLTGSGQRQSGTWVWLAEPPHRYPSTEQLLAAARAACPDLLAGIRHEFATRGFREKRADHWIGITFMEEGPERGQRRRAWVFLELRLKEIRKPPTVRNVVEAHPLTAESRALRTPELVGLGSAHIAVVGAGSLGAPLVREFAKAGVGAIEVIDRDRYEAGQSVRHVLPVTSASRQKASAVAFSAELMNPLVNVRPHNRKIRGDNADDLLAEAELVIDTTGSQSVGRMLSRKCRELDKTLIVAELSNGARGGDLVILRPTGACFMCFTLRQGMGEIPTPHAGPPSNRTATGCAHPAFSGSGFDATELAAIAARAAIGARGCCEYPDPGYDWAVVNFRDDPRWESGHLEPWPGCPLCGAE